MRPFLFLIIMSAVVLGLTQQQESRWLSRREKELLEERSILASPAPRSMGPASAGAALPAKTGRQEKPPLDLAGYLQRYQKMFANGKEPSNEEIATIQLELADASAGDLAKLPVLMEEAALVDPQLYEHAATLLLDRNPELASELAIKGRNIRNLRFIIRVWVARDPLAAGAWLATKAQTDLSSEEMNPRPPPGPLDRIDVPGLLLAAPIAAEPASADLGGLMALEGSKLEGAMEHLANVMPREGLPALFKQMGEKGRSDLIDMTLKHYPDPAAAREQLEGAGLPPEQVLKAAVTVVAGLDSVDMERGVKWFFRNTDPEQRGEGLQEIITAWTNENHCRAKEWWEKLPPGKDRQIAEQAYTEALKKPKKLPPPEPF